MGIRQRTWTWKGKEKSAWVVDYFDAKGKRRLKTFRTKRQADDWRSETKIELKQGSHVADRDSITVAEAGKKWIATCTTNGLEPTTIELYELYLRKHINPLIGSRRLNELTVPAVREFQDQLLADGRSQSTAGKVITQLGSLIADAVERGEAARNPVRERKRRSKPADRHRRQLAVGVDIPAPAEVRAILGASQGYRRALFVTAALTGLRASELRGLRWQDVDLIRATLTVSQRADWKGRIGSPKAASSRRTLPLAPMVLSALREWKLACPRRETGKKDANGVPIRELHYVFPGATGETESLRTILYRHWEPLQIAAGVSVPALDDGGNSVMAAKYAGVHALRHFFCSWCAARPQDGGLGLPLKTVQVRMGHSTLAMTADRYGHLFPSTDDTEVLAAGERALMGG
jgi:integrase